MQYPASLPTISPALQEKDFERCAEKGECCQCGLCCIAFAADVPSISGDANSPVIRKEAGQVCPQMRFDTQGRVLCLLHAAKADHPALQHCREWKGNIGIGGGKTYFDALRYTTLIEMLLPTSAGEVLLIADAWRTGRVPPSLMANAKEFLAENPDAIIKMFFLYLEHRPLPFPGDLFTWLDIKKAIESQQDRLAKFASKLEERYAHQESEERDYYRTYLRRYVLALLDTNTD